MNERPADRIGAGAQRWPAAAGVGLSVGLALLALAAVLWLAAPRPAGAAGTVGDGSPASCNEANLRAALNGGGPVNFNCGPNTVTITLGAQLEITQPTTVDGGGKIVLSGDNVTRVFTVSVGASLDVMNLTLRDGVAEYGGGIYNSGRLTATNVTFLLNTAGIAGSAIFNKLETSAYVSGSLFMHNNGQFATVGSGPEASSMLATPEGLIEPSATRLVVHASRFEENSAEQGGGIMAIGAVVTVTDSAFENNDAIAGSAIRLQVGGLRIVGTQFVSNTTLSPVVAAAGPAGGGGLLNYGGAVYATGPAVVEITDSYFERNTALYGNGGALLLSNPVELAEAAEPSGALLAAIIANSTFVENASAQLNGGAIFSYGMLSVTESTFEANTAGLACLEGGCSLPLEADAPQGLSLVGSGGAIYSQGTLAIADSRLYSNTALYGGGLASNGPAMMLVGSEVVSNVAHTMGGGLLALGFVRIADTTLAYNSTEGFGGGANLESAAGSIIERSLIHGNKAEFGGGLSTFFNLSIVNSTVSGNTAQASAGGIIDSSGLRLTNTTVVSNTAVAGVGGNLVNGPTSAAGAAPQGLVEPMRLVNSLIAFGRDSTGANNCEGQFLDAGHNLESGDDCGLTAGTSLTNTNPLITPLVQRGGPTLVHDLLDGSPAIDAANDAVCPAVDQRGAARPVDGDGAGGAVCDIGAVEAKSLLAWLYLPLISKD